jgi:SAM-dependent methyltransferase
MSSQLRRQTSRALWRAASGCCVVGCVSVSEFSSTYDALASRYDDWSAGVVPDVREAWARKIDVFLTEGEPVVELGCGTGVPVGRLLSPTYDYTGVDASAEMLAKARAVLPSVRMIHADMHAVRFSPGSLGAVVAFYSIGHTRRERHATLFAAIASWLRPGGVFIGNLHSHDDPDDYEPNWLGAGPMRWSGFDAATNVALLADAGLQVTESAVIEQTEPEGTKIYPLWLLARRDT